VGQRDAGRLRPAALIAALAAVMVPIICFFSVNVALGEIGADLDASPGMLQLVVGAYGVTYASLVVIGGRLGDSYGRKRVLLVGLGVFALTSLLCAAAQTPVELVAARLVQGTSAALVAPQVLASIHANTEGTHRTRAMAWFGATGGIATSLAFLLGGSLAQSGAGWRAVFWGAAPVAVLVAGGAARWLPESKGPRSTLDIRGALALVAMMSLLILPLTEGRALGWPVWTWVSLAAVPVAALAFGARQARLERNGGLPLVPPSLLRLRTIRIGLAVSAPMFVAFGGFMFVYAFMAGSHGLSPLDIGLSMLPMSVAFLVASIVSGRLLPRFGVAVLTAGAVLGAAGFALFAVALRGVGPQDSFGAADVLLAMVVLGLGFGLLWSPLVGVILSQVPAASAGLGGGVFLTVMQAGLGLGSAVVGAVYLGWGADGFTRTTALLAVVMLAVAGLTRALAARRA
jgi:MFS family permease